MEVAFQANTTSDLEAALACLEDLRWRQFGHAPVFARSERGSKATA